MCSEELTLSPPNGCSYFSEVEQKDAPLTSLCCDAENQYFQQVNKFGKYKCCLTFDLLALGTYQKLIICKVGDVRKKQPLEQYSSFCQKLLGLLEIESSRYMQLVPMKCDETVF